MRPCQLLRLERGVNGRIRESLVLRRSAGFQTGLPCSTVARCPPSHPRAPSRFGNRRSAKDSRMRSYDFFTLVLAFNQSKSVRGVAGKLLILAPRTGGGVSGEN